KDDSFHALAELGAWRQGDLAVIGEPRTAGKCVQSLLQNLQAFSHLLDPHPVTVVAVAVTGKRHLEVVLLIAAIWKRLADVVADTRGAQHRAGHTGFDGLIAREDADPREPPAPAGIGGPHPIERVDS